ncbi:MAG TPA: hypothetical protein VMU22_05030 [Rhizomicrobium sp.]|nr:hypothetical protein [Rhizomicrobium sp.]
MRSKAGVGAVALAVLTAATGAIGAPRCASSDEVTAIQAAAIQQQLMVAALTCNQVEHFNAFQVSYGKELRRSDASLERMFRRLYAGRGEAEYHAFKTRLANDSSIRSIHDNQNYCRDASMVFDAALIPDKPTLASFVSGIEVMEQGPINSCGMSVAVGFSGLPLVVPKPNPMRMAALAAPAAPASPASPPGGN